MLNIVTKGSVKDLLIEDDIQSIYSRIDRAKRTLLDLLNSLENKRDNSRKLEWSELTGIPKSDASGEVGISRIDSFADSVSETTAGSIYELMTPSK